MQLALAAAQEGLRDGEVPVGAVLVVGDEVWAVAHNRRESGADVSAHAEIEVLRAVGRRTGSWRLPVGSWLYVTLEPCLMCAGALRDARIAGVVFGADDPRKGAAGSVYHVLADPQLGPEVSVIGGVAEDECERLLTEFFAKRRADSFGGVSEPG